MRPHPRLTSLAALLACQWTAAAAAAQRNATGTVAFTCSAKPDAADADLSGGLGWACGAGGVNCAPIQPGGAHYDPNTVSAHASWVFNQYYQAHQKDGYDTCFFGGNAALSPAPAGHYDLVQGTARSDSALAYPTKAKQGVGATDLIAAGANLSYTSPAFSARYDGTTQLTTFSIWVASSGTCSGAASLAATLEYDFDGDGTTDRSEAFNPYPPSPTPAFQAYTSQMGTKTTSGAYTNMAKGTVALRLAASPACGALVMASTAGFPSFVNGPFLTAGTTAD